MAIMVVSIEGIYRSYCSQEDAWLRAGCGFATSLQPVGPEYIDISTLYAMVRLRLPIGQQEFHTHTCTSTLRPRAWLSSPETWRRLLSW